MATGGKSDDNKHLEWIATLGGMVKHGAIVTAYCRKCPAKKRADLGKLMKALGPDGSLLDRHPPCWMPGCSGEVLFHASPGAGTPSRPCTTMAGEAARSHAKADADRAAVARAVAKAKEERDELHRFKALRNG